MPNSYVQTDSLFRATRYRSRSTRHAVVVLNLLLLFTLAMTTAFSQPDIRATLLKAKPGLIRPIVNLQYGINNGGTRGAMAFDDLYAYLGAPDGLYRAPLPLSAASVFERIGFADKKLVNIYVHNNLLYVLKTSEAVQGPATDHAFLRSSDHGASFVPLDNTLQECFSGFCNFLTPHQALFRNNLIFINAGGGQNLLVSNNNGASWISLLGTPQSMICTHQPFELIGTRVVVGGECPLDIAYVRGGTLNASLQNWAQLPTAVTSPNLENRDIQFVRNKPSTTDVYAGTEGGLLKSTDSGQSFRFVLRHPLGSGTYPYIHEIHFPPAFPNVIVAGGFSKAVPHSVYLAFSKDNGETWYDISAKLQSFVGPPTSSSQIETVDFIGEDPQGRVLVAVDYPETKVVKIFQLRLDLAAVR